MEEANNFCGVRIDPSDVRSLEAIAMDTSEGDILKLCFAPVLPRNNVIYLEGCWVKCRRQPTVFTASGGSLPNPADEISGFIVKRTATEIILRDEQLIEHHFALADLRDTRESALSAMLSGAYVEETRTLLDVTLTRGTGSEERTLALNDVVVNRGALGGMIDCAVTIDGRFVYAMRGDGVIVATPTGSTAYALSAQGPIVDPLVPAILLVPVAPHALTHRPIAVPDNSLIAIAISHGRDASVHCDGQAHFGLTEGDRVALRRADHRARFLHPHDHDYFAMLREKLHWSETPERIRGIK